MKSLTQEVVMQLKKYIMKSFEESGKKHLLIIGCKKSGKTTVLNEILKDFDSYGGVITYVVKDDKIPPKYVFIKDINDENICGKIADRNNSCTGVTPLTETFETIGKSILNKYVNSNEKVIVIDEIGFLENNAMNYQNELIKCFNKKKVIATIKKEMTPFIEKLLNRNDVFCIDIEDNFFL